MKRKDFFRTLLTGVVGLPLLSFRKKEPEQVDYATFLVINATSLEFNFNAKTVYLFADRSKQSEFIREVFTCVFEKVVEVDLSGYIRARFLNSAEDHPAVISKTQLLKSFTITQSHTGYTWITMEIVTPSVVGSLYGKETQPIGVTEVLTI